MNDTVKYQVALRVATSMYILATKNDAADNLAPFVESIALVLGTEYPGEVSEFTYNLLFQNKRGVSFAELLSSVLTDYGVSKYEQEIIDMGAAMAAMVLEKEAS